VTIRFADCVFDTDARRLFRGGREVHLSPKAFELLRLLVDSRPRAVAKAELLGSVWPNVFVSDASLAKAVSEIRASIGDGEESPIVRTVHGYGYAFAAAVEDDGLGMDARHGVRAPVICWLFCGRREFPCPDGEHVIGRDADASILLDSPQVSRQHAKLVVRGKTATLEDLGSKNGSVVRGIRIAGPTALEPGDDVRIGPFTLVFRVGAGSGSTLSELG
jgi:DNA-binding winged helix-turn-helix (wHTH) protein